MENQDQLPLLDARAVWEAPAIVEYDAKAEIQGLTDPGPTEFGLFTS